MTGGGARLGGRRAEREQAHHERYTDGKPLEHLAIIGIEFRRVKTKRPTASIIYADSAYADLTPRIGRFNDRRSSDAREHISNR
jgi:hypothetical protein